MSSSLKQRLKECIPPAYYPDGTEAKCMWYKVFNMFDIDPQSYIIDKEKKGMENNDIEVGYQDSNNKLKSSHRQYRPSNLA